MTILLHFLNMLKVQAKRLPFLRRQTDPVVRIEGVSKKYLDSTQMVGTTITDELSWPNEVALVPGNLREDVKD